MEGIASLGHREKKPQSSEERLGVESTKLFTAFRRRPIVKRIQAGVLTCGSFYRDPVFVRRSPALIFSLGPPCPFPSFDKLRTVVPASFVPAYSGVAVLDFHEVPSWAFGHLNALFVDVN